uniref:Uncharacterized protein n=1 Tax=Anopheles arabiensis TaxID=7173 RepID=A0A182I494_ANOAR
MGNKCCSKRQDQELALAYPGGYKKGDSSFNSNLSGGPKHNNGGSIDSRYTPDPNRGQLIKHPKGGVDIIRPRTTPQNALGLCHVLSSPCPKPQPQLAILGVIGEV